MNPINKIAKILRFGIPSLSYVQASFSQFGEDFFLRSEFHNTPNGFFVDVGAYHPYKFSNTHYLRSRGWRGINIEPQPFNSKNFAKSCKNDININCAVSQQSGNLRFKVAGCISRILSDDETSSNVIIVKSRRLENIFTEYNIKKIDLLTVDCEGHDIDALKSNNWASIRPSLILAEDHNTSVDSELHDFMKSIDYALVSWYRLTKIYKPLNLI
jgi:FkbM family methyltransferase